VEGFDQKVNNKVYTSDKEIDNEYTMEMEEEYEFLFGNKIADEIESVNHSEQEESNEFEEEYQYNTNTQ